MKQSESIVKLTEALIKVQAKMEFAKKDSENPFFSKQGKPAKYADLASVLEVARELLSANGLAVVQPVEMEGDFYYVETTLLHISGEFISSKIKIAPMKQVKDVGWVPSLDPQSIGTAISYARRYALMALLCIAAEDDDGNAASGLGQKEQVKPQEKKKEEKEGPNYNFLKAMKTEKERVGDAVYYGVLKDFGVGHSNQITKREDQLKVYDVLKILHKGDTTDAG